MTNQRQIFRQHLITRGLRAAVAAGVANPSVSVQCPDGTIFTIGSGKPDEAAAAIPKQAKVPPTSPRSPRAPAGARR